MLISQIEEKEESVWASGLSCLLYFVCDRGNIRRSRLQGLDIRVSIFTHCFDIICEQIRFICNSILESLYYRLY